MAVQVAEPEPELCLAQENSEWTLKLSDNLLFVNQSIQGGPNNYKTFNVRDVIGCRSYKVTDANGSDKHKVVLVLCVRNNRGLRQCEEVVVPYDGSDAEHLVDQVYARLRVFSTENDLGLRTRFDFASGKRVLFLVNPQSGKRRALKMFNDVVEPALRDAGLRKVQSGATLEGPSYELRVTSRANDARELARTADLAPYYAIVTVSGDGLLYEVVNGLMERADWQDAMRTPVGLLPAGTGNCLVANITHAANESTRSLFTNAVYLLLRHEIVPFDMFACELSPRAVQAPSPVETPSDDAPVEMAIDAAHCPDTIRSCSFVGFMWGLLSEIDIESESLRAFGKLRYPIYAIQRALAPRFRIVSGRITYLPASALTEAELRCSTRESAPDGSLRYRFLPPIDQPIPTGPQSPWCVMEGEFLTVMVMRLSHLVEDSMLAPEMNRFDMGLGNLFVAKAGYSRIAILRQLYMFLSGNPDGIVQSESLIKVPIAAIRIEPFESRGVITLDGELIPYGSVQMELIPGFARLLAVHDNPLLPHTTNEQR